MARVLSLAPLPPAATGIATYADALHRRLERVGALADHDLEPLWPIGKDADRRVWEADLAVYHVGNNLEFHREIYVLAVRHPGLVVLHDLALDDLVAALEAVEDPLGPQTRLEAMRARRALQGAGLALDGPLEIPWCALLARRARGVVVHSAFARRYLEAIGCRTPVFVAPHVPLRAPTGFRARRAVKRVAERLGPRADGELRVGVLGDAGEAKGIDAVFRAMRLAERPIRAAVVGRRIPGFDADAAARALRVREQVEIASDVSDAEFWAWLRASDVIVNLRHPHRGEVSGTLIRAMQSGIPAVVSATGTYLDLPADAVLRVPAGPPDPVEIAKALRRLADEPGLRTRLGSAARTHADSLARTEETTRMYARAVEETLELMRDPARAALGRWAGALDDLGVGGEDLRAGLGARYAEAMAELDD